LITVSRETEETEPKNLPWNLTEEEEAASTLISDILTMAAPSGSEKSLITGQFLEFSSSSRKFRLVIQIACIQDSAHNGRLWGWEDFATSCHQTSLAAQIW